MHHSGVASSVGHYQQIPTRSPPPRTPAVYMSSYVNNTVHLVTACDYGSANLTVDLDAATFYRLRADRSAL
jgi:hypothetical protein